MAAVRGSHYFITYVGRSDIGRSEPPGLYVTFIVGGKDVQVAKQSGPNPVHSYLSTVKTAGV